MSRVSPSSDAKRPDTLSRAASVGIDLAAGFALSLLLSSSLGVYFARRAVVTLQIGNPRTLWRGPVPMMLGIVGEVVYVLPFALLVVWILEPLTGATLGKRIVGLCVRRADGRTATWSRRWWRSALQTAVLWGWTLALVLGRWEIAVAATVVGSATLALRDSLSGTMVRRC